MGGFTSGRLDDDGYIPMPSTRPGFAALWQLQQEQIPGSRWADRLREENWVVFLQDGPGRPAGLDQYLRCCYRRASGIKFPLGRTSLDPSPRTFLQLTRNCPNYYEPTILDSIASQQDRHPVRPVRFSTSFLSRWPGWLDQFLLFVRNEELVTARSPFHLPLLWVANPLILNDASAS